MRKKQDDPTKKIKIKKFPFGFESYRPAIGPTAQVQSSLSVFILFKFETLLKQYISRQK